jgi:hypothetical protein
LAWDLGSFMPKFLAMPKHLFFAAIILLFAAGCNNAGEVKEIPGIDSAVTVDSVAAVDSARQVDTTHTIPIILPHILPAQKQKSAILGYSYFTSIKRNELKNIRAYLNIKFPESKVRDTLHKIEKLQQVDIKDKDTNIINTLNINLYDYIEVDLLDPAKDYTITPINHTADKQKVDTIRGNNWGWSVLTKTDKNTTSLILKVTAYMPDSTAELDNRVIPIRIKLEKNIFRKLWTVLLDDPKYFLAVILVPFIAFLGKRYFDRKKREPAKN